MIVYTLWCLVWSDHYISDLYPLRWQFVVADGCKDPRRHAVLYCTLWCQHSFINCFAPILMCVYIYMCIDPMTHSKKTHAGLTKSKLGSHRPLLRRCHARPFGLRHVDVVGGPGACTNDCSSGSMKYNRESSKTNWVFQTNFLQWNFLKKVEKRVWDQHSSSGDFRLYWWIYIYTPSFQRPKMAEWSWCIHAWFLVGPTPPPKIVIV